ncbi:hypothetical protein DLREEDagrD3_07730 [Denitratisoma sp. agr-D3]
MDHRPRLRRTHRPLALLLACASLFSGTAGADTDLADVPLASSSSDQVKPNILFILDDSGSMNWTYMPDGLSNSTIGYRNNSCNYIYYNPAISYDIPKNYDGSLLNNSSQTTFTAAYAQGYDSFMGTNNGKDNLSTSFSADDNESGRAAYYWMLNDPTGVTSATTLTPKTGICNFSTGSVPSNATGICCNTRADKNYNTACTSPSYPTNSPASCSSPGTQTLVWKKVAVGATSSPSGGDERQNFANWYSYYRTRMMMMKASAGRALFNLSDRYRVGFMTIHPGTFDSSGSANGSSVSSSKFLKITDFDATQRSNWFSKLYAQSGNSSTPLRTALSVAGRYYAGKNDAINKGMVPSTSDDPVQYSCQQNFAILTTDGYWNDGDSRALDGASSLANQDGNIAELDAYNPSGKRFPVSPRPIFDGGTATYTWNSAEIQYQNDHATCVLSTTPTQSTGTLQKKTSTWGSWTNATSCSGGTNTCRVINWTTATAVASCTPNYTCSGSTCTYTASPVVSCGTSNNYGYLKQYRTRTTTTVYPGPNQTGSILSGPSPSSWSAWTNVDGVCYASAQTLPANGTVTGSAPPTPPDNCTSGSQVWPCETYSSSGGSSNTLSDVAQYYYKTDLRSSSLSNCTGALGGSLSVCDNNVPSTGTGGEDDKANWQHMTTFTMGLGLSGTLNYSATYKTDTSGTFDNIRKGSTNWPAPTADDPTALDDLWHAAVDGRGQYFSARDPDTVINSLTNALSGISARVASAAAAATSNLEPVAGDNFAYTAKYVTLQWTGELEAREINLTSGAISGTPIWSAQTKLDAMVGNACDNRNIKLFRSGATNNLVDFKWNTYVCDGSGNATGSAVTTLSATEQAHFDSSGSDTTGASINEISLLSQYPNLGDGSGSTVNQRSAAAGANLLNFLRGQRGKEGFDSGPPATNTNINKLYRTRNHVLGDIISAQPIFVRAPYAEYTDNGYIAFRSSLSNRTAMVYVAANDGMLHAFKAGSSVTDTEGGKEAWAFIPTMVLPNLYKLADENYATQHQFYVDGTPTAADVFDKTASADCALASPTAPENCWKTVLVGGLNKGGKGYYALDITDPANPKALWEFKNSATCLTVDATTKAPTSTAYTDCHIGYTYNNPIIGKLADGTWAVFVTSGYNNDNGVGYLYVLNAITGQVLYRIGTGVGSSSDPSGLNHINAWINNASVDNTVTRIYGVDLKGNIWRFDVNNSINPIGREATLLAQVVDANGVAQPITIKPELAEIEGSPFIYVATGRYLGTTDIANTQRQSIWAFKDPMTSTALSNIRSLLGSRTITNQGSGTSVSRLMGSTSGTCSAGDGWYLDLPDSGERANIDMKLQLGTLLVPTNVPISNACNIGGYSYLNFFDYRTGCSVVSSNNFTIGQKLTGASGVEAIIVGINVVRLPSGKTVVIITLSTGEQITFDAPFSTPAPTGKRVSWREVVQ